MNNHRDHQAEYGYNPTWDLQREKQETVAENRDERISLREYARENACDKCGDPRLYVAGNSVFCGECSNEVTSRE